MTGLRRLLGGSLQRRLLVAALGLVLLALLAAGLSIGFVLHRFVRGQVDGRLDDRILSLVSDLGRDPAGQLALGRGLEAPPFDRPRSGWYWQVRRGDEVLRSASLEGRDLGRDLDAPRPRGRAGDGIRPADGKGPWGEGLILRLRAIPGGPGEPTTLVVASAPVAALRGPVLEALRTLALCLGLLGLFLAGGALLQVRLGLRPLARLRADLAAVRSGRLARLSEGQPEEVRPLVEEMNALLDQNRAGLEAARAQVANLAHGLKTPLAALAVAVAERDRTGDLARLVEAMDRRLRHHLRRARSAAVAGPVRVRAPLGPHLADLRAALLRLHAAKAIDLTLAVPQALAVACDPQDLDEMLGNLIENACQWCNAAVRVTAEAAGAGIVVSIEDDGPGLSADEAEAVLARGRRLDESLPGNGFGLPIAAELAGLYGGGLALGRSRLGGLAARLTLPA